MHKITQFFYRFSLYFTAVITGILLVMSMVCMYGYKEYLSGGNYALGNVAVILLAIALGVLLVTLYRKMQGTGQKATVVLFLAIILLQIGFLVFVSHPMSISDPARVQNEALQMVKTQHGQMNTKDEYFQRYSNNHFMLVFFYYYYKLLFRIGITHVVIPNIVLNIFCVDIGIYITYRTAKRLRGIGFANWVLLLFLLCPTIYVWLTTVYTNTISFPFVMAVLYLALWLRHENLTVKNIIKCILLGVMMAVGYWIRPTTILPILAMILFAAVQFFKDPILVKSGERRCVNPKWNLRHKASGRRNTIVKAVLVVAVFAVTFTACGKLVDRHVNSDQVTGSFPVTHWLMMGLNQKSYGGYAREDEAYTESFPTKDMKTRADITRAKGRLHQLGVIGVVRQMGTKMLRVWAMGDDDSLPKASYASDFPVLYEYVMGNDCGAAVIYTQAFRVCIFVFLLFCVIRQIRRRDCEEMFLFTLTFLGAVMFFILWEANRKYNICFMGVYLMLMAEGGRYASAKAEENGDRIVFAKLTRQKATVSVGILCLGATILIQILLLRSHQRILDKRYYQSRNFPDAVPVSYVTNKTPKLVEQTLQKGQYATKDQWNILVISFGLDGVDLSSTKEEYEVSLISREDGKYLYRGKIAPCNLTEKRQLRIYVTGKKKVTEEGYLLRMKHIGSEYHMLPTVNKFPDLDPYPYGELSIDGKQTKFDLNMRLLYSGGKQ